MADLTDLSLNLTGWTLEREDSVQTVLRSPEGDGLGVYFFSVAPDIGGPVNDLPGLRAFYRHSAANVGGALVSADVVDAAGVPAVETIVKHPQQPTGMTYVGSITIPFADFSFVIKTQCAEHGMTGIRDSYVLDLMLKAGSVRVASGDNTLLGWLQDPYDPEFFASILRNRSDDPEWDSQFPDHPLSRCRRHLADGIIALTLSESVKAAPTFSGQPMKSSAASNPWWRFWKDH